MIEDEDATTAIPPDGSPADPLPEVPAPDEPGEAHPEIQDEPIVTPPEV